MSKILITADIHQGVPGRLQDILWSLRVIRTYAQHHNIDTIVSLGDMFHDRHALEIDVLCAAHDFFLVSKRDYNQTWITFPGNHDMFLKHSWQINSLKVFQDTLYIIDTVKILKLNDVRFWILPFIHLESAYMRILHKIYEQYQDGDVLLTHIGTTGAIKNVCFLLKDWSIVSFHDAPFDQIYTGHFHTTQQVGRNVYYPGSPIPFKFDEGDSEHGFFVYDLDRRTHNFVNIWEVGAKYFPNETPPPNYLTIAEEMLNEITPTIATNNILRIATAADYTPQRRHEIETHLKTSGAAAVRWMNVAADATYTAIRKHLTDHNQIDLFESWLEVDKSNLSNLDVGLLRRLHTDVATEADEIYNYEPDDD